MALQKLLDLGVEDVFDRSSIHKVALAALSVGGGAVVLNHVIRYRRRLELSRKRAKKQHEARATIETVRQKIAKSKLTKQRVDEISSLPTKELLAKLQNGSLKPTEALEVFQWKTLEAHDKTNCVVHFLPEAEELAQTLDQQSPKGALYGLPVGVKDDLGVKGHDSLIGCAYFIDKPFTEDAPMVALLRMNGAIPFVKTNVPQALLSFESSNPIYGTVNNPRDKTRTAGGSSGGTGALVACGGAALGLGSDFAGSIRNPSAMNGIYGFKQSAGRSCPMTASLPLHGSTLIAGINGPMARDVEGLVIAMKVFLTPPMWELDITMPPLPFNDKEYQDRRPLRIGYFTYNGVFRALPPCERAVIVAKQALEKAGHTLVPFEPPNVAGLLEGYNPAVAADGGEFMMNILKDDAVEMKAIGYIVYAFTLPKWLRVILRAIVRPFNPAMAMLMSWDMPVSDVLSTKGYWNATVKLEGVKSNFYQEWTKLGLDAVISPAFGVIPLPIGNAVTMWQAGAYTATWNVLNYPSGVVPVTSINEEDLENLQNYPTDTVYHQAAQQGMVGIGALPVSVQVSTLTWRDELCLRLMKEVDELIQYKPSPP